MSILEWPAGERPREKLLAQGAMALSDAELLALFLRTGIPGKSAVQLARESLTRFDSLSGLLTASLDEFSQIPGLGPAKYTQLQAVREMARRVLSEDLKRGLHLDQPASVRDFLRLHLSGQKREVFMGLFVDAHNCLIAAIELFAGTLTQTSVYPREVARRAIELNAASVLFAHNHPSGVARPSEADRLVTQCLQRALALLDIRTLDHFIVAGNDLYSFAEHGEL